MADVQQLVDMGFAAADAEVALRESAGHVEQALELLLTGTLPEESKPLEKDNSIGGFDANSPSEKNKFVGGTPSDWPELPKPSGYVKPETRPPGLDQGSLDSLEARLTCIHAHRHCSVVQDNVPTPQMPRQPGAPMVGNTCPSLGFFRQFEFCFVLVENHDVHEAASTPSQGMLATALSCQTLNRRRIT